MAFGHFADFVSLCWSFTWRHQDLATQVVFLAAFCLFFLHFPFIHTDCWSTGTSASCAYPTKYTGLHRALSHALLNQQRWSVAPFTAAHSAKSAETARRKFQIRVYVVKMCIDGQKIKQARLAANVALLLLGHTYT